MSLQIPTTKEVSDSIVSQMEASFGQTIPLLPKSFLRVLAKTLAAVFILHYKYAGFMVLQSFVQTASFEETEVNGKKLVPLIQWGRLIGVGDPGAATQAEFTVDVTVEAQVGSLPSNSQLFGPSNGVTYLTLSEVLLDAPTVQVPVRASGDPTNNGGSGAIGNIPVASTLSFANPLPNVGRTVTVSSIDTTGADAESEAAYRQRVVDRFRQRPQGGALSDYEQWGVEPSGILNVYPYTSECPGQVDVYVEATEASSGSPDGIPTAAQLLEVADSIDFDSNGLPSRRPANALVAVLPITRVEFTVQVAGLDVGDPVATQSDITQALQAYFAEREPYILGLTPLPRQDRITKSAVGGVVDSIVNAAGGVFADASVFRQGGLTESYSLGVGQKAKVGTITFI